MTAHYISKPLHNSPRFQIFRTDQAQSQKGLVHSMKQGKCSVMLSVAIVLINDGEGTSGSRNKQDDGENQPNYRLNLYSPKN